MKLKIGENVRKYRREAGLTQEALGDAIGVSLQAVSRWENGTSYPDIESLPVLANFFGISVDELIGTSEDKRNERVIDIFHELVDERTKENQDAERVIALIREMRKKYLDSFKGSIWWSMGSYYRLPGVLPELRKTAEAILETCTDKYLREATIYNMAVYEDDDHIGDFMEKYATSFNILDRNLYRRRYELRGETEQAEVYRQLDFYDMIGNMTRIFERRDREPTPNEECRTTTLQLCILDIICNLKPKPNHPVSCDGEVDEWSLLRIHLGIKLAGYHASKGGAGDYTFAILEDAVSLAEKIVKLVESAAEETKIRCPWLDKAQHTFSLVDIYHNGRLLISENWTIGPCSFGTPAVDLLYMLTTDDEEYKTLDPIRDDPRYTEYVERVRSFLCKE